MRFETVCERSLFVFGMIKILLIAAFFFVASLSTPQIAAAQSDVSCKGNNLLEKLEAEDTAAYKRILAEASEIENSESIFWKVEKSGQKTSWLFGTMHMADPEISTLKENVKEAILASDALVIESIDALDPIAAQKAMGELAHLTLLTEGTLSDLVEDNLEDELAAAVNARGIPMPLADRMQPWLIATTISLPICEIQRKQTGEKVLDAELADFARNSGKEVKGLESIAEQLTALASLPQDYHVSALEETLAAGDIAVDMIETLKQSYLAGKMGVVFPLMKEIMPKSGQGEGALKLQEILIDKRNVTMAERAEPILQAGSTFVAVGALHLPGETGLVKLLRAKGYSVTAIQ
ncbi:hypothetical protein GQR58_004316 [Nymphon striatum]|nr:hypothetical protein GQR58_004316 [Nymphon striatum]